MFTAAYIEGFWKCRPLWKRVTSNDVLLEGLDVVCELEEALSGLLESFDVLLIEVHLRHGDWELLTPFYVV